MSDTLFPDHEGYFQGMSPVAASYVQSQHGKPDPLDGVAQAKQADLDNKVGLGTNYVKGTIFTSDWTDPELMHIPSTPFSPQQEKQESSGLGGTVIDSDWSDPELMHIPATPIPIQRSSKGAHSVKGTAIDSGWSNPEEMRIPLTPIPIRKRTSEENKRIPEAIGKPIAAGGAILSGIGWALDNSKLKGIGAAATTLGGFINEGVPYLSDKAGLLTVDESRLPEIKPEPGQNYETKGPDSTDNMVY